MPKEGLMLVPIPRINLVFVFIWYLLPDLIIIASMWIMFRYGKGVIHWLGFGWGISLTVRSLLMFLGERALNETLFPELVGIWSALTFYVISKYKALTRIEGDQ
jgi:hypothetical protein